MFGHGGTPTVVTVSSFTHTILCIHSVCAWFRCLSLCSRGVVRPFCRARWIGRATRDGAAAADGAAAPSLEVGNRVQQQHAQHGGWALRIEDRLYFARTLLLITLFRFPPPNFSANLVFGLVVPDLLRVLIGRCSWERCGAEETALTVGVELGVGLRGRNWLSRTWQ